jgi:formylglycine-generating enzyme
MIGILASQASLVQVSGKDPSRDQRRSRAGPTQKQSDIPLFGPGATGGIRHWDLVCVCKPNDALNIESRITLFCPDARRRTFESCRRSGLSGGLRMRASHVAAFVGSHLILIACGGRSPYGQDEASCDLLGGSNQGKGGNPYSGGQFSGKGGYVTGPATLGGTSSAQGGMTGRGGTGTGVTTGGSTNRGGTGGYSGASAATSKGGAGGSSTSAAGGVTGKGGTSNGGAAGFVAKGGSVNGGTARFVAIGGRAGNAATAGTGISDGGTVGGVAVIAGNAGVMVGGASGAWDGGAPGAGSDGFSGAATAGAMTSIGGATNAGGTDSAGAPNGGTTGSVAGASPGGAGPWNGCHCGETDCGTCPTTTMVPRSVGSVSYYVDPTETTNSDYKKFVDANVNPAVQSAICIWNLSFLPNVPNWPLIGTENLPVNYLDWCDAYSYCAWAGKRLCGAIGGGETYYGDLDDPLKDEWFAACTDGNTNVYPYGSTYNPTACNGVDAGNEMLVPAGSLPLCQVGATGLYDMSGNVFEWVNACDNWTGELDTCYTRGGSYFSDASVMRCRTASTRNERNTMRPSVGFRCCKDG